MQVDPEQWSTLSRLLDAALEVPVNGLEHWLGSLPPGDAVHRTQLRKLLKQHAAAQTGDFLITLPKVGEAAACGLAPGTLIGPYIVEEEIGRGGMGAVWRARRSDGAIKRPLALKLPHAGPQSHELIARFTRERDILGELSHPNIARLDDAGITDSGQPFLALEYVPGVRLTDYCDQLQLDVRSRLQLCMQVFRAVQYAHSHLVIHRDLKPSNIIVTAEGRAMLLDFGIAKLIPDDAADDDGRTQMGAGALTPEYASPEQIAGKPVSTASDIYSLGVLLFELLTGERPYRLERATRGALEDAILGAQPQRPSTIVNRSCALARGTTVKNLSRALRGDLDTILLKALKKAPADRYSTVDALSRDIEHYLRGEPVTARADGTWYRLRKFVERYKLPVAAVSGAALVLIATAAIALFEAHVANAQRDRALALSARNEAVTEFVKMLVAESGGADAQRAASCLQFLAYIYQDGGDAANAIEYATLALQRLHQVERPLPSLEGLFLGSLGFAYQLSGANDTLRARLCHTGYCVGASSAANAAAGIGCACRNPCDCMQPARSRARPGAVCGTCQRAVNAFMRR